MHGLRSTGALLAVLLALGAYIYFVIWRQPDPSESTADRVYQSLAADDIREFTLATETGDVTTVRKEGDTWRIVAPRELPASPTQVNGMTSMIAYLDVVRVIDENPADLAEYGLDQPRITIDFAVNGDDTFPTLLVGHQTPTGASLYAKLADEPRVFLIGQHHEASLSRTTFDLREKRIVSFVRDEVDALEIVRSSERLAFKKDEGRWTVVAPISARADFTAVDTLLGSIEVAQMRAVATDEPTPDELRRYGIAPPALSANVHVGDAVTTLHLGEQADDETFYAKEESTPTVMMVEALLADDLRKPLEDFRRREVFDFQTAFTTRVELTRDGDTLVLERVRSEEPDVQDSWQRVGPPPAEADRGEVDALLAQLSALRASGFVPTAANTGLQAPVLSVRVRFNEGSREDRVDFGRMGDEAYASRPDEPGALRIDAGQLEGAIAALDELEN